MIRESDNLSGERYRLERRAIRNLAIQFLYQIDAGKDTELSAETLNVFWEQLARNKGESPEYPTSAMRESTKCLVEGVIENRPELDRVVSDCAQNWRLDRMGIIERNILRLAAYELLYCPEIPPKATLNEAIEIAKAYGDKDSPRFVNGILDKMLKIQTP